MSTMSTYVDNGIKKIKPQEPQVPPQYHDQVLYDAYAYAFYAWGEGYPTVECGVYESTQSTVDYTNVGASSFDIPTLE